MQAELSRAIDVLNQRFFVEHPGDAALELEKLPTDEALPAVERLPANVLAPVWRRMLPANAAALLGRLPDELADRLLAELPPAHAVRLLGHQPEEEAARRLERLDPAVRRDLDALRAYPRETAGYLMHTGVSTFRRDTTANEALDRLRAEGMDTARSLFLVDESQRLSGKVALADLALADSDCPLGRLEHPVVAVVRPTDTLEEISAIFEDGRVLDIPVLDLDGVMLGAITHDDIVRTIQTDATVDLQTMVGAGRGERALSSPWFAVRKRMPWLQVNLVTAFMAAAVVGLFEGTIAKVTALAVLLPVVAGQSGNTGAQALAVTMRGLALREITIRQWPQVLRKEVIAGLLNGLAVALTCGIGVFIWSQSPGLVAVIMSSMVLAMIAAGFAGAVIPVILTRLGQDPATSSSIILTTVTDIAGFFAFLGIATLLMGYLE